MSKLRSQSTRFLLIIIILLSFWLRVWGVQFGLPFVYHPDEQQYILPAINVVSGNFQPLSYYNPALYAYVIGGVYALTYLGLRLFNAFPAFFNLSIAWNDSMLPWTTGLIYLARFTSVAAGVLTTVMVYHLGRRAYRQATGVGAAIIFGLTFLPAREAHFAVSDAPVALAMTVALYLCLNIVKRGRLYDYLWTGVAFGLAAAVKYSAGLLIFPVIMAHLCSQRYHNWLSRLRYGWLMVVTGLTAVTSYLLIMPYTLLDWEKFWSHFNANLEMGRVGLQALNMDPAGGAMFYLKSLIWGLGWPVFALFLVTILFALWRHRPIDLVLLTLPIIGFVYMQRQEMFFARWLVPLVAPMAVLVAEMVQEISALASQRIIGLGDQHISKSTYRLFVCCSLFILTLPSTYMALRADYIFSQPDTRTQALNWIRQRIPPGSNLAAEVLSPPWGPPLVMPGLSIGPYHLAPVPDGGVAEVELAQYRAWGVQYIVASSFYYARPLRDQSHQAQLAARMQTLDEQAELVAVFDPYKPDYSGYFYHDQVYGPANDTLDRLRPGPIIKIYRLSQ